MKILVTGGAGFIGSNVVDRLVDEGHDVVVVDNLITGYRRNLNPHATFYEMDILDPKLTEVLELENPEVVSHHAAQIDVRKALANPCFDAEQNILGSIHLIERCLQTGVKKIIYASTGGAVYGEPEYLPVDENHPVRPISPYGISKHTVEHYLDLAATVHGLRYTVLRYANVYGPRQDPHGEAGVIAIFTERLLQGDCPTIFGDGTSTRDYVYVGDVAEANLLTLEAGDGEIYNVGTGVESSLNEVFSRFQKTIGTDTEVIYAPARPGEVDKIAISPEKLKRDLGWCPTTDLDAGLAKTVNYYRCD